MAFTVIVIDCVVPVQPFALGVTVTVPEIFAFVELVAVNDAMFPFPLAAKPILVFVFDQE